MVDVFHQAKLKVESSAVAPEPGVFQLSTFNFQLSGEGVGSLTLAATGAWGSKGRRVEGRMEGAKSGESLGGFRYGESQVSFNFQHSTFNSPVTDPKAWRLPLGRNQDLLKPGGFR